MAITFLRKGAPVSAQEAAALVKVVASAPPPPPPEPAPAPPPVQWPGDKTAPKPAKTTVKAMLAGAPTDNTPPWEAPANYSLLQALEDHAKNLYPGRTLQINAINNPSTYIVESYSPITGESVLKGPHGMILKPKITQREEGKYIPFWV